MPLDPSTFGLRRVEEVITPEPAPAPVTPQPEPSFEERGLRVMAQEAQSQPEVVRALRSGVRQLQSTVPGLRANIAALVGDQSAAAAAEADVAALQRESAAIAPEMDVTQIDSLQGGLRYFTNTLAQQLPTLGAQVALGAATGGSAAVGLRMAGAGVKTAVRGAQAAAVGTAAPVSVGQQTAEVLGSLAEAAPDSTPLERTRTASVAGVAGGALDVLPLVRTFDKLGVGKVGKKIVRDALGSRVAKEALTQGGIEAGTEVAQTLIGRGAAKYLNQNYDVFSPDGVRELLNAAAGGFLVGGTVGGAQTVFEGSAAEPAVGKLGKRLQDMDAEEETGKLRESLQFEFSPTRAGKVDKVLEALALPGLKQNQQQYGVAQVLLNRLDEAQEQFERFGGDYQGERDAARADFLSFIAPYQRRDVSLDGIQEIMGGVEYEEDVPRRTSDEEDEANPEVTAEEPSPGTRIFTPEPDQLERKPSGKTRGARLLYTTKEYAERVHGPEKAATFQDNALDKRRAELHEETTARLREDYADELENGDVTEQQIQDLASRMVREVPGDEAMIQQFMEEGQSRQQAEELTMEAAKLEIERRIRDPQQQAEFKQDPMGFLRSLRGLRVDRAGITDPFGGPVEEGTLTEAELTGGKRPVLEKPATKLPEKETGRRVFRTGEQATFLNEGDIPVVREGNLFRVNLQRAINKMFGGDRLRELPGRATDSLKRYADIARTVLADLAAKGMQVPTEQIHPDTIVYKTKDGRVLTWRDVITKTADEKRTIKRDVNALPPTDENSFELEDREDPEAGEGIEYGPQTSVIKQPRKEGTVQQPLPEQQEDVNLGQELPVSSDDAKAVREKLAKARDLRRWARGRSKEEVEEAYARTFGFEDFETEQHARVRIDERIKELEEQADELKETMDEAREETRQRNREEQLTSEQKQERERVGDTDSAADRRYARLKRLVQRARDTLQKVDQNKQKKLDALANDWAQNLGVRVNVVVGEQQQIVDVIERIMTKALDRIATLEVGSPEAVEAERAYWQLAGALVAMANGSERVRGFTIPDRETGQHHIWINPNRSLQEQIETLAHEVGHIVMEETPVDEQTARDVDSAYEEYSRKGGRENRNEWFADQVRYWLNSRAKPQSAVEKYFDGIADVLRKIFDALREAVGWKVAGTIDNFLTQVYARSNQYLAEVTAQEQGRSLAERFETIDQLQFHEEQDDPNEFTMDPLPPEQEAFIDMLKNTFPGNGVEMGKVLDFLEKRANLTPFQRKLVQLLKQHHDPVNNPIRVFYDDDFLKNIRGQGGDYYLLENEVSITDVGLNATRENGGTDYTEIVLHELVHAMTVSMLNTNKPLAEHMEKLFHYALSKLKSASVFDEHRGYGFTNVNEFVAEAFANEDLQKILAAMPPMSKNRQFKSLWAEFVGLIKQLFGSTDNLLGEVLETGARIISKNNEETAALAQRIKAMNFEKMTDQELLDIVENIISHLQIKFAELSIRFTDLLKDNTGLNAPSNADKKKQQIRWLAMMSVARKNDTAPHIDKLGKLITARLARKSSSALLVAKHRLDKMSFGSEDLHSNAHRRGPGRPIPPSGRMISPHLAAALNGNPLSGNATLAMLDIFDNVLKPEERAILARAFQGGPARRQLLNLLGNSPLARLIEGGDTRMAAALGYQFWAAGRINIGPQTKTVFQKARQFAEDTLGVMREDSRAAELMLAIQHALRTSQPLDYNIERFVDNTLPERVAANVVRMTEGLSNMMSALWGAQARMEDTKNPALIAISRLFASRAGTGGMESFFEGKTRHMGRFLTLFNNAVKDLTPEQSEMLAKSLYLPDRSAQDPEVDRARVRVFAALRQMYNYTKESGVDLGDMGENYFPWIFDEDALINDQQAFEALLAQPKHARSLQKMLEMPRAPSTQAELDAAARRVYNGLLMAMGVADDSLISLDQMNPNNLGHLPRFGFMKPRQLHFLYQDGTADEREQLAGFFSKDINFAAHTYTHQLIKRTEYVKRFGVKGEVLTKLLEEARQYGADAKDEKLVHDFVDAMLGVYGQRELHPILKNVITGVGKLLGKDWSELDPKTVRKIQGVILVYQNIRLLALAMLSSLPDIGGILARGDLETFGLALKTGIREIKNDLANAFGGRGTPQYRSGIREMAETLGTVELHMLNQALGETWGGASLSGKARKWNEWFFKVNGLQYWTRLTRIMALSAGQRFIVKMKSGTHPRSQEFLDQLGVTAADVVLNPDGTLKLLSDFEWQGASMEERERDDRIKNALNRYVDESIVRPNAAQRPLWASHPDFALIFHLKQFMYSIHDRILRRVASEAELGNYGPAMALMSYVPIMIAADMIRDEIKYAFGDDEDDNRKENWTTGDYIYSGAERSGLFGLGTIFTDAAKDINYGDQGFEHFIGPTYQQAEQVADAFLQGDSSKSRAVLSALPAQSLWKKWVD